MWGERQTRELIGPADPARSARVPPAAASATDLIHRAEAAWPAPVQETARERTPPAGRRRARPTRRLVLLAAPAAALVAAVAIAYPLLQPGGEAPAGTELGAVAVPIAYQVTDHPPPAGDPLRDLATRVAEAPYERAAGQYAYFYHKSWGDVSQESPDGHRMSYVEEREVWVADGSGLQRQAVVGVEFPDDESRQFWQSRLDRDRFREPAATVGALPDAVVAEYGPPPPDRGELADLLGAARGPGGMDKLVVATFQRHLLPWQVRAQILEILADQPGFVWRGEVTDRVGRPGVAISYDDTAHARRSVLVFDSRTGELLAQELVALAPEPELLLYSVFDAGRTDRRPEATAPGSPSPGA